MTESDIYPAAKQTSELRAAGTQSYGANTTQFLLKRASISTLDQHLHLIEEKSEAQRLSGLLKHFQGISGIQIKVEPYWGFPGCSGLKNSPAMQEPQDMQFRSLGGKDPQEEGIATHPSILAWRIPWTEEPGGLQSMGLQQSP